MALNEWMLWIKSLFVRNGMLKLLSLALALLIYFPIRSQISHVRTLTLPVEIEQGEGTVDLLDGTVVESIEPQTIRVMVRGSYTEVTRLDEKNIRCQIRPRQKKGAWLDSISFKIRSSNLRGITGVRVVKIEPAEVDVKFDVPMSCELAVAPPTLIGRARGRVELEYDKTNEPPKVVVKGSRRLLSPLDLDKVRVQSEPISVEGRTQSFTQRVKLIPPGGVLNAKVDPPEILVMVKIINEMSTARLERLPVAVTTMSGEVSKNWRAVPHTVDVELSGRAEMLSGIRQEDVKVSVSGDVPMLSGTEAVEVPVKVFLRQGLLVDDVKCVPASVKLVAAVQEEAETNTVEIVNPAAAITNRVLGVGMEKGGDE